MGSSAEMGARQVQGLGLVSSGCIIWEMLPRDLWWCLRHSLIFSRFAITLATFNLFLLCLPKGRAFILLWGC